MQGAARRRGAWHARRATWRRRAVSRAVPLTAHSHLVRTPCAHSWLARWRRRRRRRRRRHSHTPHTWGARGAQRHPSARTAAAAPPCRSCSGAHRPVPRPNQLHPNLAATQPSGPQPAAQPSAGLQAAALICCARPRHNTRPHTRHQPPAPVKPPESCIGSLTGTSSIQLEPLAAHPFAAPGA